MQAQQDDSNLAIFSIGMVMVATSILTSAYYHSAVLTIFLLAAGLYLASSNRTRDQEQLSTDALIKNDSQLPAIPQNLIFKNNVAAFEYMCMYNEFDADITPGIVTHVTLLDGTAVLKLRALFNGKVVTLDNCMNTLGKDIKVGDLVACLDFCGMQMASYQLSPELNTTSNSWKVVKNTGKITVNHLPAYTLMHPRFS